MNGEEIRKLRKDSNMTQEEFGYRIGVSWATISRWEREKSRPSRLAMEKIDSIKKGVENEKDN